MRVRGGKSARRLSQWLLAKMVRHAVILGYHRIADGPDPYRLGVSPARFAEQLAVLARMASPISMDEFPDLLARGRLPKRAVVVTFDDGYADVLHRAKPLLAHFRIPSTVFVISGALGRELWWDRLDRVATTATTLDHQFTLPIPGMTFTWPLAGMARSAEILRQTLYPELRALDRLARDAALDRLGELLNVPAGTEVGLRRVVTPDELRCLGEGDLVQIGAHTATHPALSELNVPRQREEIAGSRRHLEAALDRPVTGFSYPFGDTGAGAPAIVREAGYRYACESRNAVAWRGTDQFALPRFWVPNWDGPRFAAWLERWLDD